MANRRVLLPAHARSSPRAWTIQTVGPKNSQIKAVLDGLFESRYHARSRPKDAFRDAYGLKDEGVPTPA